MDRRLTFTYFAYGSNVWVPRMLSRCASAEVVGPAHLEGWKVVYDKPSVDGSAKLNIRRADGERVHGLVYEIDDADSAALDLAEHRYRSIQVETSRGECRTYTYTDEPHRALPFDWYVATAVRGRVEYGLSLVGVDVPSTPETQLGPLRPAEIEDHDFARFVLSEGLQSRSRRYYIHPGDFSWWMHHGDPRYGDHYTTWIWEGKGFADLDSRAPGEINVFTLPDVDRDPLLDWCHRWLGAAPEVAWIDDGDDLAAKLKSEGATSEFGYSSFEWDLTDEIPSPELSQGWTLRHVEGEHEAVERRRASHAAFQSTMDEGQHIERYLRFMRSPVYEAERDLIAVDPEGRVGAFMIWWPDDSGIAQVEPFGTDPEFQRLGLGRALLRHGARQARDEGMVTLRVCTTADTPAAKFYGRSGFKEVGKLRWWRIGSPA